MSKSKKLIAVKKTQRIRKPTIDLAAPVISRKLDLACGQSPAEGFEGVDVWSGAQHVVDLQKFPWPFEDSSVSEVRCSHYIEHIPMYPLVTKADGTTQDPLFAFFDELYRILVPDGWAEIICPSARSDRGFQDPTHRRFIVENTFAYFWRDWRVSQKLDHYNTNCNFVSSVGRSVPIEMNALSAEAQQMRFQYYWNCVWDYVVKMQAKKDPPALPAGSAPNQVTIVKR